MCGKGFRAEWLKCRERGRVGLRVYGIGCQAFGVERSWCLVYNLGIDFGEIIRFGGLISGKLLDLGIDFGEIGFGRLRYNYTHFLCTVFLRLPASLG